MSAQEQREFQIDDPEELSQKTRIREILNRRTNVIDARDRAFDAMALGDASRQQALGFYRSRIESLILDLWTKFENKDLEKGEKYLKSESIDEVTVHPPAELDDDSLADGEGLPAPKEFTIEGLQWFIENDGTIQVPFTAQSWNPPGERTAIAERPVSLRTLDHALVKCMEFIDVTGIDVDFQQEEQQTKIDRELLEEVDEWRKENVDT